VVDWNVVPVGMIAWPRNWSLMCGPPCAFADAAGSSDAAITAPSTALRLNLMT
jgi:hypothetical protein